jgi:hypothetical protein
LFRVTMVCGGVGEVFKETWSEWADKTGLQGISNARKTKSQLCRSFEHSDCHSAARVLYL